jgi:hypothetical protein
LELKIGIYLLELKIGIYLLELKLDKFHKWESQNETTI